MWTRRALHSSFNFQFGLILVSVFFLLPFVEVESILFARILFSICTKIKVNQKSNGEFDGGPKFLPIRYCRFRMFITVLGIFFCAPSFVCSPKSNFFPLDLCLFVYWPSKLLDLNRFVIRLRILVAGSVKQTFQIQFIYEIFVSFVGLVFVAVCSTPKI